MTSTTRRRLSRLAARLWQLLGVMLVTVTFTIIIITFIGAIAFRFIAGEVSILLLAIATVVTYVLREYVINALWGAGRASLKFGRQLRAVTAHELVTQDTRPPILYLRSFKDDNVESSVDYQEDLALETAEEQLKRILSKFGPVIAIGQPGEEVPSLGAARFYVSDDEWQTVITNLMLRAQLVVLRIGFTKGFWWEWQTAIQKVKPDRLLFLITEDWIYDRFRRSANKHLPCPLPKYTGDLTRIYGIRGLLYFEPDWTPHVSYSQALLPVGTIDLTR